MQRRLSAILAADVVGYSALMEADEVGTLQRLKLNRSQVFDPCVAAHGGRLFKLMGDGALVEFGSAVAAVQCALAIQAGTAASEPQRSTDERLRYRIGINVGDVILDGDDVYGEGVNVAARLESLAPAGGVAISAAVQEQVRGKLEVRFDAWGEHQVKNIQRPVQVFGWGGTAPERSARSVSKASNLPQLPPELYGREDDQAALQSLLQSQRLVTVTGTGGIGKTRLALAAAHARRAAYPDGVWWVDLAPVTGEDAVPRAVAQALALSLAGRQSPLDELANLLADSQMLLVLDNCEHVLESASRTAQLLSTRTAGVRVLATSQELLRVPGETLYRLQTLSLPSAVEPLAALDSGAVALFVARVQAQQPGFAVSEATVGDVVAICTELDGLALALEMAAARVPALGLAGVRQRLNERLRMLTSGSRTAERRHQALRETLRWSHSLLSDQEQAVFRRLAVFAGGFTLQAAQDALTDDELDEWAVLDLLCALVDKSLITVQGMDPPRYRMLETARAFALEQLALSGEAEHMARRHAQATLRLFEQAELQWGEVPLREIRRRVLPEIDNLRAALRWAHGRDDVPEIAVGLTALGEVVWIYAGAEGEGRSWFEACARFEPEVLSVPVRARYWLLCAEPPYYRGQWEASARAIQQFRELGDRKRLFWALSRRAVLAARHDTDLSLSLLLEAESVIEPGWRSAAVGSLTRSKVHYFDALGRFDELERLFHERLKIARESDDPLDESGALHGLAVTASRMGDHRTALHRGREALLHAQSHRLFGAYRRCATVIFGALVDLAQAEEALAFAREWLPVWLRQDGLRTVMEPMAQLAVLLKRHDEAAVALGRAESHYRQLDLSMTAQEANLFDRLKVDIHSALGPEATERLLSQGRGMTDEHVAQRVLA